MVKFFKSKEQVLILFAALAVGCLLVAILTGQKFSATNQALNEERYQRMVAEEQLQKAKDKVRSLEASENKTTQEMGQLNGRLNESEQAIAELKVQLEKAMKFNEVLQRELQNALVQKDAKPKP